MPAVVGQPAPDFSLRDHQNNTVTLNDLKGQKAIIAFIPFPNTGTCDNEACALRDDYESLKGQGANVVIITCHAGPLNRAWVEKNNIPFPVLSDFWPHGAVSQAFGSFNENNGSTRRVSYVLDADGIVREIIESESMGQAREHEAHARALAAIG